MINRERTNWEINFPKMQCEAKKVNKMEEKMAESSRDAFSRMRIRFLSKLGKYFSVATKIKMELFLEPYCTT